MRVVGLLNVLAVTVSAYLVVDKKDSGIDTSGTCVERPSPEAHFYGEWTHCLIVDSEQREVVIYNRTDWKHPSIRPIAVGLIREKQRGIYRENEFVPGCETRSGMNNGDLPKWTESNDQKAVGEHLAKHCFTKQHHLDERKAFPYHILYKFKHVNGNVEFDILGYQLPDSRLYRVFDDLRGLRPVCAECVIVLRGSGVRGGFGQRVLAKPQTFNVNQFIRIVRRRL